MDRLFPFATEHLVSEDRAKELTRPFWGEFTEVWTFAWNEWSKISEEHRAMLSKTAFVPAINAFAFTQWKADELFRGRESEGIVPCTGMHGVVGYYIHNEVLIRFNSVGRDHIVRSCDKGTDHKDRYFKQLPLGGLLNSATRLTIGCVPGPTRTEVGSVVISCQLGDTKHYSFHIDGGDAATVEVPTPSTSPEPKDFNEKIKHKKPR